ncbi:MAG: hypothetical protein EZS28_038500 [Streblomastix strix]|uniref:Protein kinase domain-containing protein n=1 Tax=Streblomastix strix TaxID=222440 RepID=A0A5J4U735_9EUKA|nr:MAG: hypothetical protein EZS28_038500 [Streblomastix strix]
MTSQEKEERSLHQTSQIFDILQCNLDESGNLNPKFFASVLTDAKNKEFFTSIQISSVFPNINFFKVNAQLDKDQNIILEQVSIKPTPDHFALLIRHHQQDLDSLKLYFDAELQYYKNNQENESRNLKYVGCGPTSNGCCVLFLLQNSLPLEAAIQHGFDDSSIKLEIADSLIQNIQQAHNNGYFGFDLRPNSVLFTKSNELSSVTLIGYVGNGNIIAKHPDHSILRWDPEWTSPELVALNRNKKRRKGKKQDKSEEGDNNIINIPNQASDIFALGLLLLQIFDRSNEVQDLVRIALEVIPQNRCNANDLHQKFIEFRNKLMDKKEENILKEQMNQKLIKEEEKDQKQNKEQEQQKEQQKELEIEQEKQQEKEQQKELDKEQEQMKEQELYAGTDRKK